MRACILFLLILLSPGSLLAFWPVYWELAERRTCSAPSSPTRAEKPALLIDANIHAVEVTGCTAALHLIDKLLTQYGVDEKVTRVLDTRAFYIIPRLNPDGAELALADRPKFVRSSVRPYPRLDQQDGLIEEDLDGDGRILTMRVRDPNGAWKPYPADPRLLIPRDPDDAPGSGEFYRLLPEGLIQNYDGVTIKTAPALHGLDLNRQYPMEWAPEGDQHGAGPYPTSEPEVRAMVQAVIDRPNITGYIAYHTFSGVHLRPYSGASRRRFPQRRSARLQIHRRAGDEDHGLSGQVGLSRFQVRAEASHSRRLRRLDVRSHRRVCVDDRVLESAAADRPEGLSPHRVVARSSD